MTARISLAAAVIAALIFSCDTERNIAPVYKTYFTKYYGEDGNQYGVDLAVNTDGMLVMVGRSESQTNPVTRTFIVKTDAEGNVLWERQMGGNNEQPVDVEFDSRNDILVVSNISNSGGFIRVTRISQSGVGLDSIEIHNEAGLFATAITETSRGTFFVTGYAGPTLLDDNNGLVKPDEQDLLIYELDPDFDADAELQAMQGGEQVGKIAKLFESHLEGPIRYYSFGDSDRPFGESGAFRQAFEILTLNEFFVGGPTLVPTSDDTQVSAEAIAMPVAMQQGYIMVGSSGKDPFKQIFLAQYTDGRPDLTRRFANVVPTRRSTEGVSVAYGDQETIFVLADEKQDNNNHDIYLVKLASDGRQKLGEMRFGSVEGDDLAGAVRVMPDGRVAIFGTMELETQKKMMLTLISPSGSFSE